jgi:hypothetical protein
MTRLAFELDVEIVALTFATTPGGIGVWFMPTTIHVADEVVIRQVTSLPVAAAVGPGSTDMFTNSALEKPMVH